MTEIMDRNKRHIESITTTARLINANARVKGFWQQAEQRPDIPYELFLIQKLALIGTEVSEAVEAIRSGSGTAASLKADGFSRIEEELADIIIRTLDMASQMGVNIGAVIFKKMEYNSGRAPLHGKKF